MVNTTQARKVVFVKNISRTQWVKFVLLSCILLFFGWSFTAEFGFLPGIHSLLLTWSFFVLCTPAPNGGTLIDIPFEILTGKRMLYSELLVWGFAVLFNLVSYFLSPHIYFKTTINHLLFQILSHPWPRWIIIFICAAGTLYSALIRDEHGKPLSPLHGKISKLLTLVAVLITVSLSYFELIVVLNSHGRA